ncbi:MAG: type II toxin-antitoxin system VapC family toxin [Chloroflexota bacterium]
MALPSVLVTDTNIWIDLENGGILPDVFGLPYQFLTPDFAIREFVRPKWQLLQALGLRSQELEPALIQELAFLRATNRALSATDLAAFLIARALDATLLTGDWRLSDLATENGIRVHGVLWLLDEMVRFRAISPEQAANALSQMLNQGARLPQDECRKRLASWTK